MNNLHILLAHGGRGGLVGLIVVAGVLAIFLTLAFCDRSQSPSKKD